MKIILVIIVSLVMPTAILCQNRNVKLSAEQEVKRVDDEFHKAFRLADASTVERLLTDKFIWTHSTGGVQTKAELIAGFNFGKLKYESLETDDVKVYVYGKSAVVSGLSTRNYPNKDSFQIRYTVFYVKQRGAWQAAAFHTSILPKQNQ